MLETRSTTMSNELMKIDLIVSAALDIPPDLERGYQELRILLKMEK